MGFRSPLPGAILYESTRCNAVTYALLSELVFSNGEYLMMKPSTLWSFLGRRRVESLAVVPSTPGHPATLYAGLWVGVFSSIDGGVSIALLGKHVIPAFS